MTMLFDFNKSEVTDFYATSFALKKDLMLNYLITIIFLLDTNEPAVSL
jgi:hypothetical protein